MTLRDSNIVTSSRRELDTALFVLGITNCMKQTLLRNFQRLSSIKTFHFVFEKAIFEYPFHRVKIMQMEKPIVFKNFPLLGRLKNG